MAGLLVDIGSMHRSLLNVPVRDFGTLDEAGGRTMRRASVPAAVGDHDVICVIVLLPPAAGGRSRPAGWGDEVSRFTRTPSLPVLI